MCYGLLYCRCVYESLKYFIYKYKKIILKIIFFYIYKWFFIYKYIIYIINVIIFKILGI